MSMEAGSMALIVPLISSFCAKELRRSRLIECRLSRRFDFKAVTNAGYNSYGANQVQKVPGTTGPLPEICADFDSSGSQKGLGKNLRTVASYWSEKEAIGNCSWQRDCNINFRKRE